MIAAKIGRPSQRWTTTESMRFEKARAEFERIRPINPTLNLADFAAPGSMDIVRSLSPIFFGSKLRR